jgi:alpha-beta hydrolase superfamily lysophospholipase
MGALYSEHEIGSAGARIVLSVWEPDGPDAPVAVIVFFPATMVHPLFYEALLKGFAARGFAVVGIHPVGHGKSPRTKKRFTIRDIVQNGRDAVSFAQERYMGIPIIAFGSSQGGIAAAALASEDGRIAAAFPHNVVLTELPDSIEATSFPRWLKAFYRPAQGAFKLLARLFPDRQVPLERYLDKDRISGDPAFWERVYADPLFLSTYPLSFLASLFTTRFPRLTDGTMRCPLYLIADSGDRLFTEDYTRKVFERIKAPHKEMVVFHTGEHMLMATHPQEVCEALAGKMREAALASDH